MKDLKTAVFYGSTLGDTERVAKLVAEKMEADLFIAGEGLSSASSYDVILLGSSTWGWGELQDDWNTAIDELQGANLSGKKVGVFGTGDQMGYADTYCDALGIIAEAAIDAGAEIIGRTSRDGYDFTDSKALEGDQLIGLAIDVNNQDNLTDERVTAWVEKIKAEA